MGADQIKIMASGGVASPTIPSRVGIFRGRDPRDRRRGPRRQTYVLAHAYTPDAIARACAAACARSSMAISSTTPLRA